MEQESDELRLFLAAIGRKGGLRRTKAKSEAAKRRAADRKAKEKAETVAFSGGRAPVVLVRR